MKEKCSCELGWMTLAALCFIFYKFIYFIFIYQREGSPSTQVLVFKGFLPWIHFELTYSLSEHNRSLFKRHLRTRLGPTTDLTYPWLVYITTVTIIIIIFHIFTRYIRIRHVNSPALLVRTTNDETSSALGGLSPGSGVYVKVSPVGYITPSHRTNETGTCVGDRTNFQPSRNADISGTTQNMLSSHLYKKRNGF